ncbi:HlyC/CorC family transporter [Luteolibacter pohnpeiensis]|uniref:HlyC/CorC family transporter n=1 Tax=Luteolibacter pohnpeiensis TaxID=454153 RepID=A0A934S9D5_9BACT|nr:hemolysin family protein [Luteolibacter pohnpeiensis]MBK1881769.1 HlyC/CorC family transporter [Luteolibacter pohnpeiensis]
MASTAFEILLILILLIVGGLLSVAEKAIAGARKSKLREWKEVGNKGAAIALELMESSVPLLLGIRILRTAAGVIASIAGGSQLAASLAQQFHGLPWLSPVADFTAFTLAILAICLVWLLFVEQLPAELATRYPEAIACRSAGIVQALTGMTSPVIRMLTAAANGLLRIVGSQKKPPPPLSKEELGLMIRDTLESENVPPEDFIMIERVIGFEKLTVYDIMIPRPKLTWINLATPHEQVWPKIVGSSQTHFPVWENDRDNLVGVVSVKDCYAQLAAGIEVSFKHLMRPPLLVPVTQRTSVTLELFRSTGTHVAFVLDEFGCVIGMVTLIDLMESIVGDVPTKEELRMLTIRRRDDHSWLIDGTFETDRLGEYLDDFELPANEREEFHTISGYFGVRLGRVPEMADSIEESGWKFEIVGIDGIRADQVIASRIDAKSPVTAKLAKSTSEVATTR